MVHAVFIARKLRKNSTDAEKKLWFYLRNRQLYGCKFRRQYPVAGYVVDFCCFEKKLIIELDGGQHSKRTAYDWKRSAKIVKEGFYVMRIWNHDVLQNIEGVLVSLIRMLTPSPHPSPKGRGNLSYREK